MVTVPTDCLSDSREKPKAIVCIYFPYSNKYFHNLVFEKMLRHRNDFCFGKKLSGVHACMYL